MLRFLLLFLLLLLAPPGLAAEAFVAGTEDVPLMPGLRPIEDAGLVFDKPQGRIVEAQTAGKVTRAAVRRFYQTALPELGWTADGPQSWRREGERLRIDIKGRDGDVRVGFTLSPH